MNRVPWPAISVTAAETRPFRHRKSPIPLKTIGSKKPKLLRFMEGNRQSRLLAGSPELSNPPPGSPRCRGSFLRHWAPVNRDLPAHSRPLHRSYPQNLNWSAMRKRPKPVAGRWSCTFASPGQVFRSIGRDLLAHHRRLDGKAPGETARPVTLGCGSEFFSAAGLHRSLGSAAAISSPAIAMARTGDSSTIATRSAPAVLASNNSICAARSGSVSRALGDRRRAMSSLATETWVAPSERKGKPDGARSGTPKRRSARVLPPAGEADHARRDYT